MKRRKAQDARRKVQDPLHRVTIPEPCALSQILKDQNYGVNK